MRLFGFKISRPEDEKKEEIVSFAPPTNTDGAINVGTALGGSYGTIFDVTGQIDSESTLVTAYRSLAQQPEVATAIDEIVNDAINVSDDENVVDIITDDVDVSDNVKKRIAEEFEQAIELLDFGNNAYEIFSRWYVDGRINYHVMIDRDNIKEGIQELRYLDPRKLRLVREIEDKRTDVSGVPLRQVKNEYYMYSESGFGSSTNTSSMSDGSVNGYKVSKDSIIRVTSGVQSEDNSMILSHLHKAMKHINQLRMLENAAVIYTITRAPERRIFYIDVGNLPKAKAEQYLHDMMTKHKNKLVYDSSTGSVANQKNMMTMTEDFWFPRREGSRGTEIDTLAGGQGLLDNEFLNYFLTRVHKALNVPTSRMEPETMYAFGRVSEISREEVRFSKFIRRLRARFSNLFDEILERQLILKGVITPEEWPSIKTKLRYKYNMDNYFEELKKAEIIKERVMALREMEDIIGDYVSKDWARRNILRQSDDDIKQMDKELEIERENEPEEFEED